MLPWPGGIEGTENGAFVIALAAAVLYLFHGAEGGGIKRAAIKIVPLTLFAIIAFLTGSPWLLVAGLTLSAVGDWSLAFAGEKPFLAGLGSFFFAHVAYIALFVLHSGEIKLVEEPWRMAFVALVIAHSLWMGGKLAKAVPEALKVPVIGYITVICLMCVAAAAYGSPTIIAGALLFALSDTLLAVSKFLVAETDSRQPALKGGLWVTYVAAQALILLAFAA